MKKVIKIKGMDCPHCALSAESTLNAITGVKAKVNIKKGIAAVTCGEDINDKLLTQKISEAGFDVVSITEKKGLFS